MTDYKTLYVVKQTYVFYWEYLLNCLMVDTTSTVKSKATRCKAVHLCLGANIWLLYMSETQDLGYQVDV